jgi:hypothetical protein
MCSLVKTATPPSTVSKAIPHLPLSLEEARQRQESITASAREYRKASINFISGVLNPFL